MTHAVPPKPGSAESGLVLRALACQRGERLVFRDLNLGLAAGDALMLLGPNGSGKSSLLRLLAGLLRPFAGEILWRGRAVAEDPEAYQADIAYLGHRNAIKSALSVHENLRFWAEMSGHRGAAAEAAVASALAVFALERLAHQPARLLSSGQARRLALARLPVSGARLWLLDEPSVGLDRANQTRLAEALQIHCAGGGIAIAATHAPLGLETARSLDISRYGSAAAGGTGDGTPQEDGDEDWASLWEAIR